MHKKKNKFIILCLAVVMCLSFTTSFALAHDGEKSLDGFDKSLPGNVMSNDEVLLNNIDKDLYWAGQNLVKSGFSVGYDVIAAGKNITLSNAQVAGAARIAAQYIDLTDVHVKHNATMFAQNIALNNVSFDSGIFCCKDFYFNGEAESLMVSGQTVTIKGKINGDVNVSAEELVIADDAEIAGTLSGEVKTPATISKSAKIGMMNLEEKNEPLESEVDVEETDGLLGAFSIWWFLAAILMWLAMRLLMRNTVENAGNVMMEKPGKMAAVGAVLMIVLPIAAIILMCTVIGIPISIIAIMIYSILIMISAPFSGAAAAQAVFGKLVPKMNVWGSTIIGVVVILILNEIPYVGGIIKLAEIIFTMGYFGMAFYGEYLKKDKKSKDDTMLGEGGYRYATEDEVH